MQGKLYEVWWSNGTGLHCGPRFRLLADACRYVEAHRHEASHAVRGPDGTWALIVSRDPLDVSQPRVCIADAARGAS